MFRSPYMYAYDDMAKMPFVVKSTWKPSRHNVQSLTTKTLLVLFGTPKKNNSKFGPPQKKIVRAYVRKKF